MYAFKDTVDKQAGIMSLCSESVSLDGAFIEEHVQGYRTLSVSGRESLEYSISDEDRPVGMDGMEYYGKRQGGRTLTVRFALSGADAATFMTRFRELKDFCKGEDRAIRFADEPNAHYTGTLLSLDAPEPGRLSIIGEMQFYCADPYLESDLITTVQAQMEEGKLVAHVNNDGSGSVYPVYRIKHKAENGYIGIVHTGGAFEMGNIEEADGSTYQQSESLASLKDFIALSDDHGTNFMHPSHVMDGSLMAETISGSICLRLNAIGGEATGKWCGGMRTLVLPPDSEGFYGAKNFYCYLNHWFETGLMGQTAEQSIAFLTADNKVICGYSLFKADMTGNTACLEMWANGKVLRSIAFTPSYSDNQNPFNHGRGHSDILKEGDKVTFFWFGSYPSFSVPEIKEMACHKIQIAFTQYAGRGLGDRYVTRNYLRSSDYRKLNVDKWKDEPNRYPNTSEVVVNCEEDSITVNGLPRNEEMVTGSTFYPLPPGETDIEFYTSSWCHEQPEVTVEYRKRWL